MTYVSIITQDPDPAHPGEDVTFTVEIEGLSLPKKFKGRIDPNGPDFEFTVTGPSDNTKTVSVPSGATGGTIEADGQPDFAIAVLP